MRRDRIGDAKEKNSRRNQPIFDNREELVIILGFVQNSGIVATSPIQHI